MMPKLTALAHLAVHVVDPHAVHLGRHERVDVEVGPERVAQRLVA